jgi:two-component system, sensor histidine kinase RegB
MSLTNGVPINALTQQLSQLAIIRSLLLGVLWSVFVANVWFGHIALPYRNIALVLVVMSVIQALTFLRMNTQNSVTEIEFFVQLSLDVLCLNVLFYFSGGATNPFVSYLLVPVCISAATLPWRYTWVITLFCVSAYSALLFFHVPLPIFSMNHENMNSRISWHILGMWFNFFVSAVLITYFVVKMAKSLRIQEEVLNQLKEDELRNEQVFAVAALAAGAAHEMNTPLATMTVLLSELRNEHQGNAKLLPDIELLSQQVSHCASRLKQMVQNSSTEVFGHFKEEGIKTYCTSVADRWQLMRPSVQYNLQFLDVPDEARVGYDSRLDHALINLLNNAADASPDKVILQISVKLNELCFNIIDEGAGIHHTLAGVIGKRFVTTKDSGLGIGLLLSHATIKRFGGSVTQLPNLPKGTITEIRLPLNEGSRK